MGRRIAKSRISIFPSSLLLSFMLFFQTPLELRPESQRIQSLVRQADSSNQAGLYEKALSLYSLLLAERSLPPHMRAEILVHVGTIFWNEGDLAKSALSYHDAISLSPKAGNNQAFSRAQYFLKILDFYQAGKAKMSQGDKTGSISSFRTAIEYSKNTGSADHEIKPSRLLSLVYWSIKDYATYRALNSRALDLSLQTNNRREQGNCHNNLGLYYWKFDDFSKALTHLQLASSIAKEINNSKLLNESLANQAIVYKDLGDLDTALAFAMEGLEINRKEGLNNQLAVDYLNIGAIYRQRALLQSRPEDLEKASLFFKASLDHALADNNIPLRIGILNNMGNANVDKGDYLSGKGNFENAKALALEIGDKESLCQVLNNLGLVETNLGNFEVAATHFQEAIDIAHRLGSGQVLWEAYFELGNTLNQQGKSFEALRSYKTSISIIENIRSTIHLEEYKASYFGSDKRLDSYYNIISLLLKINKSDPRLAFDQQAFNYLERAKARAFLDSLEIAEIKFDQSADIRLMNKEKELMSGISSSYTKLLNPGLTDKEQVEFEKNIEGFEEELEILKQEIREANPAYANLKYPDISDYDDVRRIFSKSNTTVIAFSLGRDTSLAFAITKGRLTTYPIPSRSDLQRRISEYNKIISDSSTTDFRLGLDLFKQLILPGLSSRTDRLIIVPDDILHLLPFEALITDDANHWLIEDYAVSYIPSLSSLKYLISRKATSQKPEKDLLAFGDPFYGPNEESPSSVNSESHHDFFAWEASNAKRLKFSTLEVNKISSLFRKSRMDIFLRQAAVEERIKSTPLNKYRILHFASHALIDDKKPARSAILLSLDQDPVEDGLLQTREIFNLNINADLVALSACQTGLGQFIRGEGIEGLNRAFFYAGASSVLISLWSVNDQATSHLMFEFYRSLRNLKTPARSLREAKMVMIRSKIFSHPFYWAGFIITGDADSRIFNSKFHKWYFPSLFAVIAITLTVIYIKRTRRSRTKSRVIS